MFGVTVSDHLMVAHSLRGEVFGPAQRLHGATYVVEATFRAAGLDDDGIVVDLGAAARLLAEVLDPLRYRNLDEEPGLAGRNTTTEVLAREVADRLAAGVAEGALGPTAPTRLTAIGVTLRETPQAWASYERSVTPS
ncbi:6-pyruvoyl tetrahydropterin synthase family protein [Nocardioides sp.]|uniref:6-pyruvoyl trahydropterin synthase family protein n=1 Tax=Nocardioides sp. TaxID=35761 RepID=UPI0035281107